MSQNTLAPILIVSCPQTPFSLQIQLSSLINISIMQTGSVAVRDEMNIHIILMTRMKNETKQRNKKQTNNASKQIDEFETKLYPIILISRLGLYWMPFVILIIICFEHYVGAHARLNQIVFLSEGSYQNRPLQYITCHHSVYKDLTNQGYFGKKQQPTVALCFIYVSG